MSRFPSLVVIVLLLLLPATALAYPSSIVFSPNGEAKESCAFNILLIRLKNLMYAMVLSRNNTRMDAMRVQR